MWVHGDLKKRLGIKSHREKGGSKEYDSASDDLERTGMLDAKQLQKFSSTTSLHGQVGYTSDHVQPSNGHSFGEDAYIDRNDIQNPYSPITPSNAAQNAYEMHPIPAQQTYTPGQGLYGQPSYPYAYNDSLSPSHHDPHNRIPSSTSSYATAIQDWGDRPGGHDRQRSAS